jgi:hypothetical protein
MILWSMYHPFWVGKAIHNHVNFPGESAQQHDARMDSLKSGRIAPQVGWGLPPLEPTGNGHDIAMDKSMDKSPPKM